MPTNRKFWCVLLLGLLLLASSVSGQIVFGQKTWGSPQFVYTHWTVTHDDLELTINQSHMPLTGFVPLKDNLELQFYVANSSSSLEFGDYDISVSGLSDTRLQISQSLSDDQIVISGGMNLPTGKKKLGYSDEWAVIELLAQDFLDVPSRKYGEGLGLSALVGIARDIGGMQVGGGISFQFNGKYEPYEEAGNYDPGDMIGINAGGELQRGPIKWSANLAYTMFTADKLEDKKTLKQGSQLAVGLGVVHETETRAIGGSLSYLIRDRNETYDSDESVLSCLKSYGNELVVNGFATLQPAAGWTVTPSASLQKLAARESSFRIATIIEDDFGAGSILGAGCGINREITPQIDAGLGFRYFTGSTDGGDIDLSGYQIGLSLSATL
ncbi:MAG: hypothetical protein KAT79_06820 [candidate division Zixibacteria bacterium]|nr:hypothetical protein [candidate division Zixibacteria bacterium]